MKLRDRYTVRRASDEDKNLCMLLMNNTKSRILASTALPTACHVMPLSTCMHARGERDFSLPAGCDLGGRESVAADLCNFLGSRKPGSM